MPSVGVMINARFEGIEERLLPERILRPPLATDKRKEAAASAAAKRDAPYSALASPSVPPSRPSQTAPGRALPALPPSLAATPEAWTTVMRRAGKKKQPQQSAAVSLIAPTVQPPKPNPSQQRRGKKERRGKNKEGAFQVAEKAKPKLPPKRSPAVIIKLQKVAAAKRVTYASVLERAAEKVDLGEIGLEGGLRIRRSVTGARLLELPQATPEKADKLAAELRVALDGVAEVVRPFKRVAIKIKGLDDSATREKVRNAICSVSQCPNESILVGEMW